MLIIDVAPHPDPDNAFFDPYPQFVPLLIDNKNTKSGICICREEDKAAPLQRCGRCRMQSYCSKECQNFAWTWRISPHKMVCKDLAKLRGIREGIVSDDEDATEFERRAEEAGFSAQQIRVLVLSMMLPEMHAADSVIKQGPGK